MNRLSLKQVTALIIVLMMAMGAGPMMVQVGGHISSHGKHTHHATQHASVACNIMCTALNFIQSDPAVTQSRPLFFATVEVKPILFFPAPVFSPLQPRAPPA